MAKFINPYNFIPFGSDRVESKNEKEEYYSDKQNLKSGWLEVSIHAKTPFIIPNGAFPQYINTHTGKEVKAPVEDEKKKLHKKYRFMRDSEEIPFVPGSEIRGMVRSVYEALTNSCMPVFLHKKPISHRIPMYSAIKKRGLLQHKNGQWTLYSTIAETKKVSVEKDGTIKLSEKDVTRKLSEKEIPGYTSDNGNSFLQYNIPVSKKEYYIAYLIKKDIVYSWNKDDDYAYKMLKSVLKRDGAIGGKNPNEKPQKALLQALEKAVNDENQMVPVYYFIVNRQNRGKNEKLVYISGSSIGRIAQYRKWEDIMGEHRPCEGPDLCPACMLFGTIEGSGLKSHLRFTDAYLDNDQEFKSTNHTLQILGGPRDSAFEFYYRKPTEEANYWNADFYSISVEIGNRKSKGEFFDLDKATPRGRKMYWHSTPATDVEMSNLNSTMEAFEGKAPFKFKIFFNQITKEQLDNLIWTLTLGDNNVDSNLQHKLGHAKPLGYGSVKLTVDRCVERSVQISNNDEYSINVNETSIKDSIDSANIDQSSVNVKSVLKMCDFTSTKGTPVMYPRFINKRGSDDIFNWFTENRKNKNTLVVLPEPLDNNITLNGTWKSKDAESGEIDAEVFSVDDYNNIYLKSTDKIQRNSRVKAKDLNGKKYNAGDKIKVVFVDTNEKNGKTYYNYRIVN